MDPGMVRHGTSHRQTTAKKYESWGLERGGRSAGGGRLYDRPRRRDAQGFYRLRRVENDLKKLRRGCFGQQVAGLCICRRWADSGSRGVSRANTRLV